MTTSVLYPGPLEYRESSAVLKPFTLSVSFLGSLPADLSIEEIVSEFSCSVLVGCADIFLQHHSRFRYQYLCPSNMPILCSLL
jgi:hypothetical protein